MSVAMQPSEYGDPILALDCEREGSRFVPPYDMTPGERANGGQP